MKRIYRSSSEKVFGGVCGGIADYFGLDPVIVRIIWVVAVLIGGTGVLAYLIALLIVASDKDGTKHLDSYNVNKPAIGYIFIGLGVLMLIKMYWDPAIIHWIPSFNLWSPIGLISIGLILIFVSIENRNLNSDKIYPSHVDKEAEHRETNSTKNLARSRSERMLLGICGGIGMKYSIDPVIIRLGWIILTVITGGAGILMYIVLYFVIPLEPVKPTWQISK